MLCPSLFVLFYVFLSKSKRYRMQGFKGQPRKFFDRMIATNSHSSPLWGSPDNHQSSIFLIHYCYECTPLSLYRNTSHTRPTLTNTPTLNRTCVVMYAATATFTFSQWLRFQDNHTASFGDMTLVNTVTELVGSSKNSFYNVARNV